MPTATDTAAMTARVTDISGLARIGALALGSFAAVFLVWGVLVPIAGAVIAPGRVVSDGNIRILSHEGGGVVAEIRAREGQRVVAGETVILLDPVNAEARLDQLRARLAGLDLKIARLVAERDGTVFPPSWDTFAEFVADHDPALLPDLLADQAGEHTNWVARRDAELAAVGSQGDALERKRDGLVAEIAALERQRGSLDQDLELRREALADGFGRAARLREIERETARLDGTLAQTQARLEALDRQRAEIASRLKAAGAGFAQQVSTELAASRAERLELAERLDAAQTAVDRVEIRADAAGVINRLHVNTVGGAVEPFAPLVEIVPDDAPLLVEARIAPTDIDEVHAGQAADVVFAAFSRDAHDPVPATVVFVSADARADERTGAEFYTARLSVDPVDGGDLRIVPGMPVESYFSTGRHTLLQFLLEPVTDSFSRAFR